MTGRRPAGRHLDTQAVLDFLEDRLEAAARARVEEHLATPCEKCREAVRTTGELLERMRLDRTPDVPEHLHHLALDAFAAVPRAERAPGVLERLAKLVFDSAATPAPAVSRRAVGASRLLRFAAGENTLELEIEAETSSEFTVRGRLAADDPALWRLDLEVGAEQRTAWFDADGAFALERVPAGRARLTLTGPSGSHRFPLVRLR